MKRKIKVFDIQAVEEPVNEPTVIEEPKDDKPTKELVKCQYCNKSMLPKSLKYSHYQNCQGFKNINKINDKTPTPTPPPPPFAEPVAAVCPPPPPPPAAKAAINTIVIPLGFVQTVEL